MANDKKTYETSNRVAFIILGLLFLALALMGALCLAQQLKGSIFTMLTTALYGVAGSFGYVICGVVAWLGLICMFTAGRHVSLRAFVIALLLLLVITGMVNLLSRVNQLQSFMDYVVEYNNTAVRRPNGSSWGSMLLGAYDVCSKQCIGQGGGLLGMVLAWPAWQPGGTVFGTILLGIAGLALLLILIRFDLGKALRNVRQAAEIRKGEREKKKAAELYKKQLQEQERQRLENDQLRRTPAYVRMSSAYGVPTQGTNPYAANVPPAQGGSPQYPPAGWNPQSAVAPQQQTPPMYQEIVTVPGEPTLWERLKGKGKSRPQQNTPEAEEALRQQEISQIRERILQSEAAVRDLYGKPEESSSASGSSAYQRPGGQAQSSGMQPQPGVNPYVRPGSGTQAAKKEKAFQQKNEPAPSDSGTNTPKEDGQPDSQFSVKESETPIPDISQTPPQSQPETERSQFHGPFESIYGSSMAAIQAESGHKNPQSNPNVPSQEKPPQESLSPLERLRNLGSQLPEFSTKNKPGKIAPSQNEMAPVQIPEGNPQSSPPPQPSDAPAKVSKGSWMDKLPFRQAAASDSKTAPAIPQAPAQPSPSPAACDLPAVYTPPKNELLVAGEKPGEIFHGDEDRFKARQLEKTLESFGIPSKVERVTHGPAVTRFELSLLQSGINVRRIQGLDGNIAMDMASNGGIRIEIPIPGTNLFGIEVPNPTVESVSLSEVLFSPEMKAAKSPLTVALGKDIAGRPVLCDLAKMPHLLIAGQTGSGKSVCINTIINSLIYRASPRDVRFIMIDPKVVELQCYNGIPHLITPVVSDPHKAAGALTWVVGEMLDRYHKMQALGVREVSSYNKKVENESEKLPRIVVIIDELSDLMMACRKEVEDSIIRIAQLARAAGIHLVLATQRPTVNVITGLIKANVPSRIAFSVASNTDSRTILDQNGAEKLLGKGDMFYFPSDAKAPLRVQGCYLSDSEIEQIVADVRSHSEAAYDPNVQEIIDKAEGASPSAPSPFDEADTTGVDPRLGEAIELVMQAESGSISLLQRRMSIGHGRAGRLMDQMEERGIVGPDQGSKPRKLLITLEEYERIKDSLV